MRPVISTADKLNIAVREMLRAHQAIKDGIATHAEKHEHTLHKQRAHAAQQRKIDKGIERQNG